MNNLRSKILFGFLLMLFFRIETYAQTPTAILSSHSTTCGISNGTAEVYPSGGVGGYTFLWSNGLTTDSVFGLASGPYAVTVYSGTDSVVKAMNIGASATPTVTASATKDTFCLNSNDTLTALASGPGGTYSWSGGTLTSATTGNPIIVSALTQGGYTYTVTWTDAAGQCTATNTHLLIALNVTASLVTVTQPSCGRNNGQIQCSVTGNRFNCSFYKSGTLIQSGGATAIGNLLPGEYKFTVDELSTGCSATVDSIMLSDTTTYPVFSNVLVTPEACYGNKNGAIVVAVGNCSSGCTYNWSQSGTDHTDSATSLQAGSYTLSVTKGGCSNIDTTIIVPGPASKLADTLHTHPDHCNRSVGSAQVLTGGGTPPYGYVWSLGSAVAPGNDSVASVPGDTTLQVIVTDSHGCADTLSGPIGNTPGPSARITNVDTICSADSNGLLIVKATSNDGPFTYLWSSGSTTPVASGLGSGMYTVSVTNAVGCDTVLHPVVQAYAPVITLTATPSDIYPGETVGLLTTISVPYKDIRWNPSVLGSRGSLEAYDQPQQTTQYTVTVTYGLSCLLTDSVIVTVHTDTSRMVVPNVFTPNGDQLNDDFKLIEYQKELQSFHIWIYDRWGNKVYESTDKDFVWDGTDIFAGNKPLKTAVFTYAIEYTLYNQPDKKIKGGNISLIK